MPNLIDITHALFIGSGAALLALLLTWPFRKLWRWRKGRKVPQIRTPEQQAEYEHLTEGISVAQKRHISNLRQGYTYSAAEDMREIKSLTTLRNKLPECPHAATGTTKPIPAVFRYAESAEKPDRVTRADYDKLVTDHLAHARANAEFAEAMRQWVTKVDVTLDLAESASGRPSALARIEARIAALEAALKPAEPGVLIDGARWRGFIWEPTGAVYLCAGDRDIASLLGQWRKVGDYSWPPSFFVNTGYTELSPNETRALVDEARKAGAV